MLLSIIIPTKNRPDYCLSALKSMQNITSDDLEILVVDNSHDDMSSQIAKIGNPQIRYIHSPTAVSVNDNFNKAINLAKGRYLTLLGDDDAIHPEILDIVRKTEELGIDVLTSTRPAQYYWPDVKFRLYGKKFSGKLELKPFRGTIIPIDHKKALKECLTSGARVVGELPKAYYGIVRKACLDELQRRSGTICKLSPDMSIAVGLAFTTKRIFRLDFPVFLPGTSGRSTAGLGAAGKHRGRLEDQSHLSREDINQWHPMNPRFFSGPTVWAEACLRTLKALGEEGMTSNFSFTDLYARCLIFEPDQSREVFLTVKRYISTNSKSTMLIFCKIFSNYLREWQRRGHILVSNLINLTGLTKTSRFQADTTESAVKILSSKAKISTIDWSL